LQEEIIKVLTSFADTYKISSPFWTDIKIEDKGESVEATVYVSIKLLPNPMFLTNISFAAKLQKLVSNPIAILSDNRPLRIYFACEENGIAKQSAHKKFGNPNNSDIPGEFYAEMHAQSMEKLGSIITDIPTGLAVTYWVARGIGAVLENAMKAGEPREEQLPGGVTIKL
jgi:hypothetical protein